MLDNKIAEQEYPTIPQLLEMSAKLQEKFGCAADIQVYNWTFESNRQEVSYWIYLDIRLENNTYSGYGRKLTSWSSCYSHFCTLMNEGIPEDSDNA